MKIIRKSGHVEHAEFHLFFESRSRPGSGFGVDCDKDGNVTESKLNSCTRDRLATIVNDSDYFPPDVMDFSRTVFEPAIGRCNCGAEVYLDGFTNTCDCGRDYNMSGQELAPREQWGEETGESYADIVGPGNGDGFFD